MIDTHCHLDQYPNPHKIAEEAEIRGTIVLGMTYLPSHFKMGYLHIRKFKKIRLALGMHPLFAQEHKNEFPLFTRMLSCTSYIGEVGLDYSREGIDTKELQLESFNFVLKQIQNEKKLISIHSKRAEEDVLNHLLKYNIKNAIFHWYSGSLKTLDRIIEHGYYFSINPMMTNSINGKKIIARIPQKQILTESDGPFTQTNNKLLHPVDVKKVLEHLSKSWNQPFQIVESKINQNFQRLINNI